MCTFRSLSRFHPACEICVSHAAVTYLGLLFSLCFVYFGVKLHPIIRRSRFKHQGWGSWNSIKEYFLFCLWQFCYHPRWCSHGCFSNMKIFWWMLSLTGKQKKILAGKTMIHTNVIQSPQGIDHTQYKCRRQCVPCAICDARNEKFITKFSRHIEHNQAINWGEHLHRILYFMWHNISIQNCLGFLFIIIKNWYNFLWFNCWSVINHTKMGWFHPLENIAWYWYYYMFD